MSCSLLPWLMIAERYLAPKQPVSLGAGEGNRTPDPLITNQMLYHLSYASKTLPDRRDNH
jgi:hypothetical protein